ncbi:MAG: ABC transporter substrate-binding protein, partial [Deltaproteobacteria bacterium]|nr:ABC transporter substrate-binding protein [Deltaproteobacteria bacterium]
MKVSKKSVVACFSLLLILCLAVYGSSYAFAAKEEKAATVKTTKEGAVKGSMAEKVPKPNAAFDADKMSDMSDFDPATWVSPTGDTIKIAVITCFSGPGAFNGQIAWAVASWVAHDINKRGGIWVDGKKKLIEVVKGDHMSKPDQCKKVSERLALKEKVHVFWGTAGSNMMKIMNETAQKYGIISHCVSNLADGLQDSTNFSRYAFMTSVGTEQVGRGMAYYYALRGKEKKFYILCQDYSYGHEIADGFKKGLEEYYPEAQIVGEDYHKLFLTDFAPYLTKIKASGAEVIYTGNWPPDGGTVLKQARQMGIKRPFAHVLMNDPNMLHDVGLE